MKVSFFEIIDQIQDFLWVETKTSKVIPFILNNIQRAFVEIVGKYIDDNPDKPKRFIILKGRQFGFSTLILAILFVKCLLVDNTRAAVIAHNQEATKKLFRRVRFFAKTLTLKPTLDKESEREYSFPRTNSYFYIGTAGAKAFGRGDNLTDVHCSEVAFWENGAELMNGLKEAVGKTGTIIIETTANGVGNFFYKLWNKSYKNPNAAWLALFFKWTEFSEYELDPGDNFHRTDEERRLCALHPDLTDRKLAWRRWKISETEAQPGLTPEQMFQQEYPLTPRESFISSGKSVYSLTALEAYEPKPPIDEDDGLIIWQKPDGVSMTYMGVDVSEGLENRDRSVIDIYNSNLEQIAQWAGWCDTDELAEKVCNFGRRYKSYVVPEVNSMGIAVVNIIKKKYFNKGLLYKREDFDKYYKEKVMRVGWRSTKISKGRLIADHANAIREHQIKFNSQDTIDECMSFVRDGKGGMGAEEGANDDRVIASALALQGYLDRPPKTKILTVERLAEINVEKANIKWRQERAKKERKRNLRKKMLGLGLKTR